MVCFHRLTKILWNIVFLHCSLVAPTIFYYSIHWVNDTYIDNEFKNWKQNCKNCKINNKCCQTIMFVNFIKVLTSFNWMSQIISDDIRRFFLLYYSRTTIVCATIVNEVLEASYSPREKTNGIRKSSFPSWKIHGIWETPRQRVGFMCDNWTFVQATVP